MRDGKSVETGNATLGECANGGATVQVAGEPGTKKAVCNGEDGQTGFVANLPEGETETGAFGMRWGAAGLNATAISFPLPLVEELGQSNVHAVNPQGEEFDISLPGFKEPENCFGSAAAPTAPAGHLCVYVGSVSGATSSVPLIQKTTASGFGIDFGANTSGAVLWFQASTAGGATGTFAVTGAIEG